MRGNAPRRGWIRRGKGSHKEAKGVALSMSRRRQNAMKNPRFRQKSAETHTTPMLLEVLRRRGGKETDDVQRKRSKSIGPKVSKGDH